jgi:predicted RNA binding protein YcfA (HicA-like mRNA interferase family)
LELTPEVYSKQIPRQKGITVFEFANMRLKDKEVKKLVSALEDAGLDVSRTPGKHHIKVVNPNTKKVVFFGAQSLGDNRAGKNILRDLKKVGFRSNIKL